MPEALFSSIWTQRNTQGTKQGINWAKGVQYFSYAKPIIPQSVNSKVYLGWILNVNLIYYD